MKIFLHGLESSSRGAKATFLRGLFPEMVTPDFTGSLSERMTTLHAVLAGQNDIVLTGSSFGGLMATIFAMEKKDLVDRVVLLAPALNFPEIADYTQCRIHMPARMIIGRDDTVTPAEKVVPIARQIFVNLRYDEVDDDHMLSRTFRKLDWQSMLTG